ncbi:MAG: DUF3450 family protein [Planctomycetota bacterium]
MMASKKNITLLIQPVLVFLLSSCTFLEAPLGVSPLPEPEQAPQSSASENRFKESSSEGPTAVESAIELSQRYAKLSEEASRLRLKNQDLAGQNHRLKEEVATLEIQLQQAQKELTEANDLLREMLIELNNWKTDVIGFRQEMRGAQKAQLEALLRILKVLGGEVKTDLVQGEDATADAQPTSEPVQPQSQ